MSQGNWSNAALNNYTVIARKRLINCSNEDNPQAKHEGQESHIKIRIWPHVNHTSLPEVHSATVAFGTLTCSK